jgi:hypothetical protein
MDCYSQPVPCRWSTGLALSLLLDFGANAGRFSDPSDTCLLWFYRTYIFLSKFFAPSKMSSEFMILFLHSNVTSPSVCAAALTV